MLLGADGRLVFHQRPSVGLLVKLRLPAGVPPRMPQAYLASQPDQEKTLSQLLSHVLVEEEKAAQLGEAALL